MRISKKSPKKEKRIMTFSLYANLFEASCIVVANSDLKFKIAY